ncbi:MAG: Ni/Fe hydrogenase subunit alpha [Candidatus Competibacterales bacterium]|nr:Ni/Fe hydrogenase subunit alpha [Candidatus Competibacterales bacterium]
MTETRTIKVDALARVEGEGALKVRIKAGAIQELEFRIFEPPRFFEALLRGRPYGEAPDITARICGICPIAYMMGASQAMEDALGVTLPDELIALRRLIYCGEWIQSHVLHAYMLHAPDFLGFEDSIQLARAHPGVVERALSLKKLGNQLMEAVGGRAVHPVNLRVGGFYRAPRRAELQALVPALERAVEDSRETLRLFAGFDYPDYRTDYTCVSLRHPGEYPILFGRLISNRGLDIGIEQFPDHVSEEHVARSNALHGHLRDTDSYLVGPIARYNNNFDRLSPLAREAAAEAGLGPVCDNPFQSLLVRAVEVLYACEEALRIVRDYREPEASAVAIEPRAGEGHGCTEAPRGICYHRYRLDDEGRILEAQIVPPTSQNQRQIERDLWGVVEAHMDLPDPELQWRCEQTIRNYDPCISCATHFLKLSVERD